MAKKVSITTMEEIAKRDFKNEATFEWHGVEVEVTPTLQLEEALMFARDVVDNCYGEDGEYLPEAYEIALRAAVITYHTNIKLPDNTKRSYAILFGTDIVKCVLEHINMDQYDTIVWAIDDKIRYTNDSRKNELRAALDEFTESVNNMDANMQAIFGTSAEGVAETMQLMSKFENMDDVTEEDVARMMLKMAKEEVN